MRKLISIICPVLNEESNIDRFYETIKTVIADIPTYDWEIIFTDNHSTDGTREKILSLCAQDPTLRYVRFSRNFGFQLSIATGYRMARGVAAIQLDCDLQDPPKLIPAFLTLWSEGYKVVYGVRKDRKEGSLSKLIRKAFYRVLNLLSEHPLPLDAGDFRLIDRCIIDELIKIKDPHLYIRGRIAEMGFQQIGVAYERDARIAGTSKFSFFRNLSLAIDAITSHSSFPLRFASFFGFLITFLSGIAFIVYLTLHFLGKIYFPLGFMTLFFTQLFALGIVSLFMGILGEYTSRIFDALKKPTRPIIEESVLSSLENENL